MQPYRLPFIARHHEMGMDHLLRIQCLCNYMEEAAGLHAEALGVGMEKLAEQDLAWVLVKMRLIVHRRPGPGEEATVETWPVAVERVQFRRDFIIYDGKKERLATAVTQWVVMGVQSRRLERFPVVIADMRPDNPPLAQDSGDIRIPALGDAGRSGPRFPVRLADIDQNRHVNNGRYVDFALESADLAGMTGQLRRLDCIFRAEGLRGDTIAVRWQPEADTAGSLIHSLCREADGQELARARTVFA